LFAGQSLKFGNVGAGDEGALSGAGYDGAADLLILLDFGDDFSELGDHILIEGVEFVRPMDGDGEDVVGEVGE
jgi:hypothetical protein